MPLLHRLIGDPDRARVLLRLRWGALGSAAGEFFAHWPVVRRIVRDVRWPARQVAPSEEGEEGGKGVHDAGAYRWECQIQSHLVRRYFFTIVFIMSALCTFTRSFS